jgi:hypothetical protein
MQGHDSYLVLAKGIKRCSNGIRRFLHEGAMAKLLHTRLRRLERRDRHFGGEMPRSAREMTDAQLHRAIARFHNLGHLDDPWTPNQVATLSDEPLRRFILETNGEASDGA